ncbi:MAG: hypothetical protein ACFB0B_11185 [Thermonemataceae bacterium]
MITKEKLLTLLEKSEPTDLSKRYEAWSKLTQEDQEKLTLLGAIEVAQAYDDEYPSEENYWSANYPIALAYYPYNGCDVYTDGKSYFFVYRDFGGHAPEMRCRAIRQTLLV